MGEGNHFAGIFASPGGPVIFLDNQKVAARFGSTVADTEPTTDRMRRFTLTHDGSVAFTLDYRERDGIGTNPYNNEIEDIDLLAAIAAGLRNEHYFTSYASLQKY